MSVAQRWTRLNEKVISLSLRERLMIFVTGLVLIVFPSYSYWLDPSYQATRASDVQYQQNVQQIAQLQGEMEIANILLARDPDGPVKKELALLQQGIVELDQQLNASTLDLVSAQKMAQLLEQLLSNSQQLSLISVASIAPVPLLAMSDDFNNDVNLFQHGLTFTFEGGYFAVKDFLLALEQLPDKFYWQSLHYQVKQYPQAQVELKIYTLSTNKDFIRG